MILQMLILAGCTSGPSPGPLDTTQAVGPKEVVVDDAARVDALSGQWLTGFRLTSGSDLDRNGIAEWALSAPRFGDYWSEAAAVRVFEELTEVAVRHPESADFEQDFGHLLDSHDVDSDGFVDLLYSSGSGNDGRLHVVRSVDSLLDSAIALAVPERDAHYPMVPSAIDLVAPTSSGSASTALSLWANSGRSALVWSELPLGAASASNAWVVDYDTHLVAEVATNQAPYVETIAFLGNIVVLDDVPGKREMFGGRGTKVIATGEDLNRPFLCPVQLGLTVPDDCVWLGEDDSSSFGRIQDAFDLDGDGSLELITTAAQPAPADGAVTVFNRDGAWRATIRGSKSAQLGFSLHCTVDDLGETWLLVSQANLFNEEMGTVYAFKGSSLVGELTDADADRFYVANANPSLGREIETYRATPGAPLQLLLSDPYDGDGVVFVLPFDPP